MRRDIEFKSEGVTCRGWLYTPDKAQKPFPVVVMAGGWCYVKEIVMPYYAESFAKAGLAVLLFDYRYFGVSDGEPRQHVDPTKEMEDYKNGITFLETLQEIDSERIGVWGISMSGGYVVALGATDPRIKSIVGVVPTMDGYRTMRRAHGTEGFRRFQELILEDRRNRFKTGKSGRMPMTAVDHHKVVSVWPYPETNRIFLDIKAKEAPLHEHWNTIESAELLLSYNVIPLAYRNHVPTLLITAEGDDLTPIEYAIEAFNKIGTQDKKLVIQPKSTHMAFYDERAKIDIAIEYSTNWFVDHLVKPYTR